MKATVPGAAGLNDPVTGIVWLLRRMRQCDQRIEAGQVVLFGTCIASLECPPGSRIDADFGPVGSVAVVLPEGSAGWSRISRPENPQSVPPAVQVG